MTLTALSPVALTVAVTQMEHDDDKNWCSINEAARRLRVTPTAIRNRIKRGTLDTKPNGNHGRLVRVPLPVRPTVSLTVTGTGSETETGTVPPTMQERVTLPVTPTVPDPLVPELRAQIGQLEARLGAVQAELMAMAERAGATEAQLTALQAQVIEVREDRNAWRQQAERLAASAERRPWWKRLAG